jgi:hypothetical protein
VAVVAQRHPAHPPDGGGQGNGNVGGQPGAALGLPQRAERCGLPPGVLQVE